MKTKVYEVFTVENPNSSFGRGYRNHLAYVTAKRRDSAIKKFNKEHGKFDMGMDIEVRSDRDMQDRYMKLYEQYRNIMEEMTEIEREMN